MTAIKNRESSQCQILNYTKCGTEFRNEIAVDPIDVDAPLFLATTLRWTKTSDEYNRNNRSTWQAKGKIDDSYSFKKSELQVKNLAENAFFPGDRRRRRRAGDAATGSILPPCPSEIANMACGKREPEPEVKLHSLVEPILEADQFEIPKEAFAAAGPSLSL